MNNLDIQNQIRQAALRERAQHPSGVLGVVISYDSESNTATVVVSSADSDDIEEIIYKVPCPVLLGIQSVAPEPGRPCYVIFKGGNRSQALISHFYNHLYNDKDYVIQSRADMAMPSYLLNI